MFIIVPKRNKRLPTADPPDPTSRAIEMAARKPAVRTVEAGDVSTLPTNFLEEDRGPPRSSMACDACRIRKTKCNGHEPCNRCRQREIICVYSRPLRRDLPASVSKIALLQHQQRRLQAAIRQMALVIDRHEGETTRGSEKLSVTELLQKYAPKPTFRDTLPGAASSTTAAGKRGYDEKSSEDTSSKRTCRQNDLGADPPQVQRDHESITNENRSKLSTSCVASDAQDGVIEESSEPFERFALLLKSMSNMKNASEGKAPDLPSTEAQTQLHVPGSLQAGTLPWSTTTLVYGQQIMDLVDWDTSMEAFQNFYHNPSDQGDLFGVSDIEEGWPELELPSHLLLEQELAAPLGDMTTGFAGT